MGDGTLPRGVEGGGMGFWLTIKQKSHKMAILVKIKPYLFY